MAANNNSNNNNSANPGQAWPPPPHHRAYPHQMPYQPHYLYPPAPGPPYPPTTNPAAVAAAAGHVGALPNQQQQQHMTAYRGMAQQPQQPPPPRVGMAPQQYQHNMYYPTPHHLYPYAPDASAMAAAAAAAVASGTQPMRKSPTNSFDSNIRSIDNAISAPGNAYSSTTPAPGCFRTGSTISSFGDFDMPQPHHVPPYHAPPPEPRESDADRARRAFNEADKDKSGYITFREFLESIADLALKIPYHDALDKFSKLDTDKDGRVVETEFVNGYLKDRLGSSFR